MKKFAKVFENKNGNQMLLRIQSGEDSDFEVQFALEFDDAFVNVSLGFDTREKAQSFLDNYPQEKAELILDNPQKFIEDLLS